MDIVYTRPETIFAPRIFLSWSLKIILFENKKSSLRIRKIYYSSSCDMIIKKFKIFSEI